MADVTGADLYISANCIDIDDWAGADEAKKLRIVNVASRDLARFYPQYTIPDAAVYEFANVLATVFGDTAGIAQKGVVSTSVGGKVSVNFKDSAVNGPGGSTRKYIPQAALDLIGAENGVKLALRRTGRLVL
ncbi:hypothetical protein [Paenibacillus tengchongensis]|uniref:hypothetical protein n=1 Tax=Paenibacillus tengchongensis TaxID=2608684 RepID=UPI00124EE5C0|nr:hypothetical protein [Paenibacillus tengchongensis]